MRQGAGGRGVREQRKVGMMKEIGVLSYKFWVNGVRF
jgi:hypothetical protein